MEVSGIDIQSAISKFVNFSKFKTHPDLHPGELHLIDLNTGKAPRFSGPNSNLFGRNGYEGRMNIDGNAKPWSMPITYIDKLSLENDFFYHKAEKEGKDKKDILRLKNIADKNYLDKLSKYQPKTISEKIAKFTIEKAYKLKLRFGMGASSAQIFNKETG